MFIKVFLLFIFTLFVPGLLFLFLYKIGQQYVLLKAQKKKGAKWTDLFQFGDKKNNPIRQEAFLMYPIFSPIIIEQNDREEVVKIKKGLKRIHIGLYVILILLFLTGIYAAKAFPEGLI